MPFDELNRGDPFRGDFPGRTDHEPWDELEAAVQRQVRELAQLRYQPATRHHMLGSLQRRRQHDAVTQLGYLPVEVGFDPLHVPGELLITGHSYDGRHAPVSGWGPDRYARGHLDALGMDPSEVDCPELHGRLVRLTHQDMAPSELANLARFLRRRGFAASLTHIIPTAPVTKAVGGPLPAPSPGPFQPDNGPGPPARVAIIDTGIADQPRTDGWLQEISGSKDPLDTFPYPAGDGYLDADAGHGTFIAGIVQQIAPGAEITVYRAVDSDGVASEVAVACEMIRAVKEGGAQIVNLSLGSHTQDNTPPLAIQAALDIIGEWERESDDRQVVIVASAGNYGDTTPCWPAAFRRVVSVAALTPDMQPSPWSSRGFWVTCSTVGQGLRSTYVAGRESPQLNPSPHNFGPDAWAVWNGTSFAAAQVTGALALLHEKYRYPLRRALDKLLGAGRPIPDFGQAAKILPGL